MRMPNPSNLGMKKETLLESKKPEGLRCALYVSPLYGFAVKGARRQRVTTAPPAPALRRLRPTYLALSRRLLYENPEGQAPRQLGRFVGA